MSDPTHSDPIAADTVEAATPTSSEAAPVVAAASDATPPTSDQVRMALRKVKDPELNLNIIDLGLVYDIAVDGGDVAIDMTLTSPGCPAGPQIMGDVERAAKAMAGVTAVNINLVWEPFWSPEKIEPRVRAYMGL
ncbi:MAG TPA: metal-sulfur cluster assembly factor [Gemmatimonadaceae bacterium]|jgi:metal-sulfur cluster biosynthetic enzyme